MIGLPETCTRAARVVAKAGMPLEPSKCTAWTNSSPRAQWRGARSRRPSGFRGKTCRQRSQREEILHRKMLRRGEDSNQLHTVARCMYSFTCSFAARAFHHVGDMCTIDVQK